jgi:hypothetical protein
MLPISFNQLFAKNLFNIPLPTQAGGICRECGGPIEPGKGRNINIPEKEGGKDYTNTWTDEGLIAQNESTLVCEACFLVGKGSTTRSTTIPPRGQVLLVTPERTYPLAEKLVPVWKNKGCKKDMVYKNELTIPDFLGMLPDLPTPFGVIIGNGGKNDKHFFRSVPLNWGLGDNLTALVMANYWFVSFRWKVLKQACEYSLERNIVQMPKKAQSEALDAAIKEFGLTGTEGRLLLYSLAAQK